MRPTQKKLGPWDLAGLAVGGLLALDTAAVLVLMVLGEKMLVSLLEAGVVMAVLALVALGLSFVGGRWGMGAFSRRVLLGALVASGLTLVLLLVALAALMAGA